MRFLLDESADARLVVHLQASDCCLVEAVREHFTYARLLLIVGVSCDKDVVHIAAELARLSPFVFACRSRHPRSSPPEDVFAAFAHFGIPGKCLDTVGAATHAALAAAADDDPVLGTGSLFTVAEVREEVLDLPPEPIRRCTRPGPRRDAPSDRSLRLLWPDTPEQLRIIVSLCGLG